MSVSEYTDKSVLLTLFEVIKASIEANVTEIREVVIFTGQLSNESKQRPFEYPYVAVQVQIDWDMPQAVGVSTGNPAVSGAIGRQKKGIANIQIHTLFSNRDDDTNTFLQNEPIRHKVHRAIDLLDNDPHFTELLKTQDLVPIDFDSVQDYITSYTCMVKEGAYIGVTKDTIDSFGVDESGDRPPLTIS